MHEIRAGALCLREFLDDLHRYISGWQEAYRPCLYGDSAGLWGDLDRVIIEKLREGCSKFGVPAPDDLKDDQMLYRLGIPSMRRLGHRVG
jgi:hypothetical protein